MGSSWSTAEPSVVKAEAMKTVSAQRCPVQEEAQPVRGTVVSLQSGCHSVKCWAEFLLPNSPFVSAR